MGAQKLLPADELVRAQCAQEPIHLSGAIQPHGALLVLDPDSMRIIQCSENTGAILGAAAPLLLETELGELVGQAAQSRVRSALAVGMSGAANPLAVHVAGRPFDVMVHRVDGLGVVEFEPADASSDSRDYLPALHAAIRRLSTAEDVGDLRRQAARELRRLTGYDQVMVYHFHPDGHGEVMADDHEAGMTPYLGLHFPASDIPVQARRLYLLKGSGLISSTDYRPAALLPIDNPRTGAPLDLTMAELRSVSPHHLQFMRNMGQGASLTLPLVLDGQLLGMVTCAHRGPRLVPFLLRRACEVLAQQVTLHLDAMARTQQLTGQLQVHDVRDLLVEQMRTELDVTAGLLNQAVTVLDLVKADGATLCLHEQLTSIGSTPTDAETTALLAALTAGESGVPPLVSEALSADRPDLAGLVDSVAGLFVLPFGNGGDCVVWFRREISRTVDWLGAQSADNRPTPLAPRNSFELWRQTVTGHSTDWDDMEIAEAVELGRDIDQVLLRRAEVQMAHMGLHDPLTGLPNRRLLMDRISSAIARADRHGGAVAILFCDLDDFKRVNDTAGHAAGDAVLVEAATRLSAVLRAGDSVARVGGDEFVIVLEPAEAGDSLLVATRIAERVQVDLCRPIAYEGREHMISVSVGMTFAGPGSRVDELMRDADAAMYRAKQGGKNRVAAFDDSLRAGILERDAAEQALRTALSHPGTDHPRLSVAYQPIVDLDSGRLISFEALARLSDSDGRSVAREVFTAVAEQTGLIDALGEVVLDAALAGLVHWRAENPADASAGIAVNFSARQALQAGLPALVRAALHRHGLSAPDLTLELTESVLMEAGSSTLRQLTELHDAGVGICIDDFGTGYASLRYLAILPVDAVKIGRSFTAGLPHDPTSVTIVRAIAGLASDMGLACVVMGIETDEQLDALPTGVLGQGFLLGRASASPSNDWPRPTGTELRVTKIGAGPGVRHEMRPTG